jgi:hypothetical protein
MPDVDSECNMTKTDYPLAVRISSVSLVLPGSRLGFVLTLDLRVDRPSPSLGMPELLQKDPAETGIIQED